MLGRISNNSDQTSRQPLRSKLLRFFSHSSFPRPILSKARASFSASAPNLQTDTAVGNNVSVTPRGILRKQLSTSSSSEDPSSPPTSFPPETEENLEPATIEAMTALPLQQQVKALLRQIGAMDVERNELEARLQESERKRKDAERKLRDIQGPQGRRGSNSSTQSDDGRLEALQAELTFQQAQGVSRQEVLHKLLELEETRTQQLLQWNEERSVLQSSLTALSVRNFQLEGQVAQLRESELDLQSQNNSSGSGSANLGDTGGAQSEAAKWAAKEKMYMSRIGLLRHELTDERNSNQARVASLESLRREYVQIISTIQHERLDLFKQIENLTQYKARKEREVESLEIERDALAEVVRELETATAAKEQDDDGRTTVKENMLLRIRLQRMEREMTAARPIEKRILTTAPMSSWYGRQKSGVALAAG